MSFLFRMVGMMVLLTGRIVATTNGEQELPLTIKSRDRPNRVIRYPQRPTTALTGVTQGHEFLLSCRCRTLSFSCHIASSFLLEHSFGGRNSSCHIGFVRLPVAHRDPHTSLSSP